MKYLLFLVPLILFTCQSDTKRLIGHWHNLDYNPSSKLLTVDFVDSVSIINDRMDISMTCEGKYQLNNDTIYYYICGQPDIVKYAFEGDTILLDNERFINITKNSQACSDIFFSKLKLKVKLLELNNSIPFDSVLDINGNIVFGHDKSLIEDKKDSILIQVNHNLGWFNDINNYLKAMEESYEDENIKKTIILTNDKNTPKWMTDSTINIIQKHQIIDKIYKTCIDKETGSIGLVEIN